jgi:stearoyl-CoA desaturase (delta-9 desaturase)
MTIISIFGLVYFFYDGGTIWQLILIRIIGLFFSANHNIGAHRWLVHHSFKPTLFGKYSMLAGIVVTGFGKPLHLVFAHIIHHKYSDELLDPHSPKYHSLLELLLGRYTIHDQYVIPKQFFKEREAVFVNKYYWELFWLFNLILACIDLKIALIFTPVNFVFSWTITNIVNYYAHKEGDLIGPATLNKFLTFISLGEGLHKAHHNNPSSYDFSIEGGFDLGKKFIDVFLIKKT